MAAPTSVIERVRDQLGDPRTFFSEEMSGHGQNRAYELPVINVDPTGLFVSVNGTEVVAADYTLISEDGYLRFDTPPALGDTIIVEGYWWAWYTDTALARYTGYVWDQYLQSETEDPTDEDELLDLLEENPDFANVLALAATVEGLWVEVTKAARALETSSPEVSVPAQQRYGHLMQLLDMKLGELRKAEAYLNIGRYKIEVFDLRRVSRTTGRYVPTYRDREIEQSDWPLERVLPPVSKKDTLNR